MRRSSQIVVPKLVREHFKHPAKAGKVTIPGHLADDLHPKTIKSIRKQAGLV